MKNLGDLEFVERVFKAELNEIKARRAEVRRRTPAPEGMVTEHPREVATDGGPPSVLRGLVGLSLSGGGIRSAAFSLGVLQALDANGIFPHVDYLSTVSGGGWIGSCLSALMRGPDTRFPFVPPDHATATDPSARNRVLEYLRDRASALVPSGFSGGSGMLARVLRGSLITLAMLMATLLVPALLLALMVRFYIHLLSLVTERLSVGEPPWSAFMVVTPRILGVSVLFLLLMPVFRTVIPGPRRFVYAEPQFIRLFTLCLTSFAFESHVFVTYRVTQSLNAVQVNYRSFFTHLARWMLPSHPPSATSLVILSACIAALFALRTSLYRVLPLLRVAALSLVALGSLAPLYLFVLYISILESGSGYATGMEISLQWGSGVLSLSLLGVAFIVVMDTNEASLHGLFRRQISNLFIIRKDEKREWIPDGWVPLTELSGARSIAPYHLLNAALNLQGSNDPSLRGRNSDFFFFSKHFIGGPRTGYCPTRDFERIAPDLDLATAMTTSAAAAAPNMGTYTLRPVVLLMAFLNLRLGYWLLNPSRVRRDAPAKPGAWEKFRSFPAGWCYFRELASALHEHGQHVYLSDGGHLENTGAYELLRRRCKYVIVCDAEEDPAMRFGGMAALIRFARLDLGVEIDITLDDLIPDERRMSRRHSALARIRYPARDGLPEEHGQLVYLKSSLTGDEHPVIGQYRAENPLFPHESTSNQAFGEAQFEAYRALGEHIARGLAGDRFMFHFGQDPVARWFHAIEARVASSPRYDKLFPDLRDEFEEVDTLLRAPEAAGYFAELYPELAPRKAWPEVAPAVLHEIAMRQIHLMASVYTQLQLDDERALEHPWHRGWIQTFRRWMSSASFQRVWLVGAQSYGPWFRKFCVENFYFNFYLSWVHTSHEAVEQSDLALRALPPRDPTLGALYFQCDVATTQVSIPWVAVARIGFKLVDDRALLWLENYDTRPGYRDLALSEEASDALTLALTERGLTFSNDPPPRDAIPSGPPLRADALAMLRNALTAANAPTNELPPS